MSTNQSDNVSLNVLDQGDSTVPLKVVLLGKKNVGKTSLFLRIRNDTFDINATKPVPNYCEKEIILTQGERVKMTLYYPEPGMYSYHNQSLTHSYYTGAVAALIVYSADDAKSIEGLGDAIKEIKNNSTNAKLFLIRNKIDLACTVTPEEALNKLKDEGYDPKSVKTIDTSASSGHGISDLLQKIGKVIFEARCPEERNNVKILESGSSSHGSVGTKCCNH